MVTTGAVFTALTVDVRAIAGVVGTDDGAATFLVATVPLVAGAGDFEALAVFFLIAVIWMKRGLFNPVFVAEPSKWEANKRAAFV